MSQEVDGRIIKKIGEFVGDGVRSVKEMQRVIRLFVKNDLFHGATVPPVENRRFSPLAKDIRNHMHRATTKLRLSKIDQANLFMKINEWKKAAPNDSFYFRSYKGAEEKKSGTEQYFYDENGHRIEMVRKKNCLSHSALYTFICIAQYHTKCLFLPNARYFYQIFNSRIIVI